MALAQLVDNLAALYLGGCHLTVKTASALAERRLLSGKTAAQHTHVAHGIVEHLAVGGIVFYESLIAALLSLSLGQFLTRGGYLCLYVGTLCGIHLLCGTELQGAQLKLHCVDKPYLTAGLKAVALIHAEREQATVLLG